jgi:glycerophosphoryl diester phosphodiesterase
VKSIKFLITSLYFWAVTAVAAQNSVDIEIVVHRGANALAPENTIASADSALKYGAKWIEVDVRKSKDGELFNLHDETLDRTTNGKGLLSEMLAKDVRNVDAGSWFGPQFEGTPLPSIAEMLDFLKGKANVFFDVKRGTPIPSLVKLVREKGFADKSFFWFGDEAMLHEFTALAPEMKIKVNAGDIDRLIYWQRICKPSYVEIAPEKITDAFRAYCHQHGIKVIAACQEDDTSQFQLVIDKQADMVNLDRPEVFLPMLRKARSTFTLRTDLLAIPSDGKTLCTQQLQQAIDQINEKGGGRLILARGAYLTGGLMLRSGVELFLEEGATLLGSTNPDDYQPISISHIDDTRNDNASMALLMADKAEHISITGSGTIDGQGLALALNIDSLHHTGERLDPYYNQRRQRPSEMVRPKLLFFHDCKDIHVTGIKLRNSANWGLSFHLCEQLSLLRLDIENRAYWNNDGIDLTDCRHVLVADCQINSADDGVCLKSYHADRECYDIEIARLSIRSSASAVKFGTASWGGFRNIYVHDLKVRDTFRSAIAIESVDGAKIDSVLVERIDAKNTGNPIFLRLGQRAGERKGSLRNVTIRNFTCEVPFGRPDEAYDLRGPEVDFFHNPFPSSICGIPDNPIEKVVLENINITYPGRATKGMAYMPLWRKGDVPEQINKYPEFTMFGELPAWGFYLRHVRSILLKNVQLSLRDEDYRPSIVDEDVEGLVIIHNP